LPNTSHRSVLKSAAWVMAGFASWALIGADSSESEIRIEEQRLPAS
jgi:hypothetical protein